MRHIFIGRDSFRATTTSNSNFFAIKLTKSIGNARWYCSALLTIIFTLCSLAVTAATYYIAPNGSNFAKGDIKHPFATLNKAWAVVAAGDIIYVRGGTYLFNKPQDIRQKNGKPGKLIKVWAYPGEVPIFTRGPLYPPVADNGAGVAFSGNYVHFKGLTITGFIQDYGADNLGTWVPAFAAYHSSHCIFEQLNMYNNMHGFLLQGNDCTDNLILNCDSHSNQDPLSGGIGVVPYGGADGFSIKGFNSSATVTLRGCRSWGNSDDGYDFYGYEGNAILDHCWSFLNGYIPGTTMPGGNGNGFKLGPTAKNEFTKVKKTLTNCVAFQNSAWGIEKNGAKHAFILYNNTAFKNVKGGFYFYDLPGVANIARNNIAFANVAVNAYFNKESRADHNTFLGNSSGNPNPAYKVTKADFVSLNSTGSDGPRQSDGSLPKLTFLHLVAGSDLINSGVYVGIPFNGSAPDMGAFENPTASP